jgi:F-type H+-transporting ATPase subunit epsilon
MSIRCEIVSADKQVFSGQADIVVLPGTEGEMGILPNHAPLLTTLKLGVVTIRSHGQEEHFTVTGGIAEVQPDVVTVLADAAENVEEIDIERAQAARRRAEEILTRGAAPDTDSYLRMEAALRRSQLRMDAVKRFRRGAAKKSRLVE